MNAPSFTYLAVENHKFSTNFLATLVAYLRGKLYNTKDNIERGDLCQILNHKLNV